MSLLTQGRLVRIDRVTQEVEPWLAERWEVSPDHRTFTLTLREGLVWSDGTPFTSGDVLFTFAALYDPRTQSSVASALRSGGQPLTVAAPDPRTVVITFPTVFAPGIRILDNLTMLPKHKLEGALDAGAFAQGLDGRHSALRVGRRSGRSASPSTFRRSAWCSTATRISGGKTSAEFSCLISIG